MKDLEVWSPVSGQAGGFLRRETSTSLRFIVALGDVINEKMDFECFEQRRIGQGPKTLLGPCFQIEMPSPLEIRVFLNTL